MSKTMWFHSSWDMKLKLIERDSGVGVINVKEVREWRCSLKGANYLVAENDLTLGGGHTMRYTDHIS